MPLQEALSSFERFFSCPQNVTWNSSTASSYNGGKLEEVLGTRSLGLL
jgi:hypothetical protein